MWFSKAFAMSDKKCCLTIFIHILICLSFLSPGMSVVSNETDRLALLQFKAKITDDPLGIMRLWNDSTHFCEWYGVVCSSRHPRVTRLYLPSLKLAGSISPHIGDLSFLRDLELYNNSFIHQIPPEVGHLQRLQFLLLHNNLLSGVIPPNVSSCSELRGLKLSYNKLEGVIPVELGLLSKLQIFAASSNNLTGTLPNSLGNFTFLTFLSLKSNKLVGSIPTTLGSLSQLVFFGVGGNFLSGELPSSIFNLSSLEALDVAENQLRGCLPSTLFQTLPSLQWVGFSDNYFTGPIPFSLSNASNLENVDFSANNFTGKVPSLESLSTLSWFSVSNNKLGSGAGVHDDLNFLCSLVNATAVQYLLVSDNNFGGTLPGCIGNLLSGHLLLEELGELSSLYELDASGNMLSGELPSSLGLCTTLLELRLGQNNFWGSIPSSFGYLSGLEYLDISSNNLSGRIPEFLASFNLRMLNLSFNHLEGLVPSKGVFENSIATFLEGNQKLCGGLPDFHLPACGYSPKINQRRMSTMAKVIIATVAGISCVALMILVFSLLKRKQSRGKVDISLSVNSPPPFVSYRDLHRATKGFSRGRLIGAGNFGSVYKGVIGAERQHVAIKVLNLKRVGATRSFATECEALRNMRHRNLVKIVTVCSGVDHLGNDFKALVYEFMPNKSLEEWLYPALDERVPGRKLGLLQRLNIAIDVASLLEYAHRQLETPLVHCDIKPSNILLDHEVSGHVSDFGLAKFLYNSIQSSSSYGVRGTVGYTPPEYGVGSQVSTQGDVYSYGILLLQMFTGKRPTDEVFKEGLSLHLYAKRHCLQRNVVDILDPILLQDLLDNMDQVWDASLNTLIRNPRRAIGADTTVIDGLGSVVEIGVACSLESPTKRMEISVVVAKLNKIRDNLTKRKYKYLILPMLVNE